MPEISLYSHKILAIMSLVMTFITGFSAMAFVLESKSLKQHPQELHKHVPALDKLVSIFVISLWIGFCLLTLSLLTGFLFMRPAFELTPQTAKAIWAVLIWSWYATTLFRLYVSKWSYKKIARLCMFGFILLMSTFFMIMSLT